MPRVRKISLEASSMLGVVGSVMLRVLSRSNGATMVREMAPASPPAMSLSYLLFGGTMDSLGRKMYQN